MRNKSLGNHAQAMVEFAIALPILLALLIGIFEVGRMVFIYAAVTNASREASRYGSAVGLDDTGNYAKYQYCDGIREMAWRSAYFLNLTINIEYDNGPGTSVFDTCTGPVDTGVNVNSGSDLDRVIVTVSANYSPMLTLIPISSRTITSSSARTILGIFELDSTGLATSTSGPAPTSTATVPTSTGTLPPTNTPTSTSTSFSGPVVTFTALPSNTPSPIPSFTPTGTLVPTSTETPTPIFTSTITPTSVTGCSSVSSSSISVNSTMSMTITNPNSYPLTVSNVQVIWNHDLGHKAGSDKTLKLVSASLGGIFWTGNAVGPSATLTPVTTLIIGANSTSTITFTFHQTYDSDRTDGTESIVINLSTLGCESSPIHRP